MEEEDDDDDDEKRRGKLIQSCQEANMYTFVIVPNDFSGSTNTVCFFVLCKRHQLNRVPGGTWEVSVYTFRLDSHAGVAVLPLALLGTPVSIARTYSHIKHPRLLPTCAQ